eukprot:RCo018727
MGHKYTKILPPEDQSPPAQCSASAPDADSCGPALYLGSIDYLVEDDILDELGVNSIVTVLPHQPTMMGEVMQKHHIAAEDFALFPLEDNRTEYISLFDPPGISAIADFIHAKRMQGKVVLVHCDAGITRSPAVVIAYLMKYGLDLQHPTTMSYRDAYSYVRRLRESLDVVLFSAELQEVETQLASSPVESRPSTDSLGPLVPSEPPRESSKAVVSADLAVLHHTWSRIREAPGGLEGFGLAFYAHLKELGGARFVEMFRTVKMDRQARMLTKMLSQLVSGITEDDIRRLVRSHTHLGITAADFGVFTHAMLESLEKTCASAWTMECDEAWRGFLTTLFREWQASLLGRC